MTLQIRYECPQCDQVLALDFHNLAPGYRRVCSNCESPVRMTKAGLERFSRDLQQYFQA